MFPLCIAMDILERAIRRRGMYILLDPRECVSLLIITRGTAEHVLELVRQTLEPRAKL